jgi:erythromycin esterase-like protein
LGVCSKSLKRKFKDTVEVMAISFLDSRPVDVLAFGEPTHGEPAFPRARNQLFRELADRGFRSIAIESDRLAGNLVDEYVRGGAGTLDEVLAEGFTHGFGAQAATRELVEWMRTHNDTVPAADRLAFHGFDAPLEMMSAASPGPSLRHLRDYLAGELGAAALPADAAHISRLAGDDATWSDPAAQMDAAKSVGRSPGAAALRVLADDLLVLLYAHAPSLLAADARRWHRARLNATTALGLLRYHAVAADPAAAAERTSRLLAVRDVLMARNLLDIRVAEQHRGPTLVFASNRHLQRYPSRWRLSGMDLEWFGAGAILAALLGDKYAVIAGSLGASAALGLEAPAEDTYEGRLGAATGEGPLLVAGSIDLADLRVRDDMTPEQGYFPLDGETVAHSDAIWHADRFPPAAAALAARIAALPGVAQQQAGPRTGAPELGWDDRFFFAGEERMFPFATIVAHDIPGFDEESGLDRAGIFRLNIDVRREEFRRLFGYGPEQFAEHRDTIDCAAADTLMPHPAYAVQGWVSVINPGVRTEAEVERLLESAHRRASEREARRAQRAP